MMPERYFNVILCYVHQYHELPTLPSISSKAEKAMETYRANMRVEGWVFDLENDPNGSDPNSIVGQRCRRYFKQAGKFVCIFGLLLPKKAA